MPQELLLDSQIRFWVFLPLLILSFLEGILSHYAVTLIGSIKPLHLCQIEDNQALARSKLLRKNGHLLSHKPFNVRRNFFNNSNNGYLLNEAKNLPPPTPIHSLIKDPAFINDLLKGNITKIIPMVIGGGWINWMFSGFVTTKLPFALALQFKPMLQRGIELESLSPSWVSSASWYFLNIFGIRSIYSLFLNEDETFEDNDMSMLMPMPPSNTKGPLKIEWEALEMYEHKWTLEKIESEFVKIK